MKEPLTVFKDTDIPERNTHADALKRKNLLGCLVPLFCMGLAGAFVMGVIRMGPPKPVQPARAEMPEKKGAPKAAESERKKLASLTLESERTEQQTTSNSFEEGDEVQPVADCMGFAEATDLNTFRMMLRHGDSESARHYFEQLQTSHKSVKLPALLHMTVATTSWNGSLQVIAGAEGWWVAQEWLEPATDVEPEKSRSETPEM